MPTLVQAWNFESDHESGVSEELQDRSDAIAPSNRGKFSPDRATWDRIHQDRYMQWQLGESIESIAADHGVTYNAIKNSIQRCEVRLRPAEVLAGRNMRLRLRTISGLQDDYFAALKTLISDESPFVRLKALEHIRRTSGMENAGLQVNQVNVQNNVGGYASYEERLTRIRAAQKAANGSEGFREHARVLELLPSGAPESE